jgi:hypothetical protein
MAALQQISLYAPAARHAPRSVDRIEILPPREAEREAARGRDDGDGAAWSGWRDGRMGQRRQPATVPVGFMAQFLAQRDPGNAAHIEDWRGARGAYARADRLSASGAPGLSIIL